MTTFTEILHSESEKLYQVLKGKVNDPSQAFIIQEVALLFARFVLLELTATKYRTR